MIGYKILDTSLCHCLLGCHANSAFADAIEADDNQTIIAARTAILYVMVEVDAHGTAAVKVGTSWSRTLVVACTTIGVRVEICACATAAAGERAWTCVATIATIIRIRIYIGTSRYTATSWRDSTAIESAGQAILWIYEQVDAFTTTTSRCQTATCPCTFATIIRVGARGHAKTVATNLIRKASHTTTSTVEKIIARVGAHTHATMTTRTERCHTIDIATTASRVSRNVGTNTISTA